MISSFKGAYRFLSNFHPSPMTFGALGHPFSVNLKVPTVEHGYQAMKTSDPEEARWVLKSETPGQAKWRGRRVTLREDWEEEKQQVMFNLVIAKFRQNPDLAEQLIATGEVQLVEGNTWNDTYWGVCRGKGRNELGKILMLVRSILRDGEE